MAIEGKRLRMPSHPVTEPETTDDAPTPFTVGTRGSELALVQATATEALLAAAFPELPIARRIIKTTGDRRTDVALADVAKAEGTFDKGVFIKELEQALDDGSIDIAVHSLKDLPTVLDPRFALAAVLERAPIRDVLVTRDGGGFDSLPAGARVGTSSVRRAKQVEFLRPDLEVVDLRGNVPTRLQKLSNRRQPRRHSASRSRLGAARVIYPKSPEQDGPEPVLDMPGLFATRLDQEHVLPGRRTRCHRPGNPRRRLAQPRVRGSHRRCGHLAADHRRARVPAPAGRRLPHSRRRVFLTFRTACSISRPGFSPKPAASRKSGEARGTDPITVAQSLFQSLT